MILFPEYKFFKITVSSRCENRVFGPPLDYFTYIRCLQEYKRRNAVCIYGFCLMPDFVHLIIKSSSLESLRAFLGEVQQAYGFYFKNRYGCRAPMTRQQLRISRIRQGVDLVNCIRTIEESPLRAGLTQSIQKYPWSSYGYRKRECFTHLFLSKYIKEGEYLDDSSLKKSVIEGKIVNNALSQR